MVLNFDNLAAFSAIFSHLFTAHGLFIRLRLKFWHRHSIPWPNICPSRWKFSPSLKLIRPSVAYRVLAANTLLDLVTFTLTFW